MTMLEWVVAIVISTAASFFFGSWKGIDAGITLYLVLLLWTFLVSTRYEQK